MNLFDDRISIEDYKHSPEYPKHTDWRLPENRLEAFYRVYYTRIMEGDLDHWLAGKVIADYMELNEEQKAWFCLLFGFSYRNHWAMIVLQVFPRIWETSVEDIREWYNDSPSNKQHGAWRRAKFAKDTKWNVRKFPEFIESVQKWLNGESLHERLKALSTVGDTKANFTKLNTELQSLYGIGRMTAWLAIQTIYEFFDYDIDHWDLQLDEDATWSQFNAMCYLFDRNELSGSEVVYVDGKRTVVKHERTKESIALMQDNTAVLMDYLNSRCPFHVDIFNVESVLCEYRKTAYGPKIKEFTGWTYAEIVAQFDELVALWADYKDPIDWFPYILAYVTKGGNLYPWYSEDYFRVVSETGLNLNTHYHFDDEPNAYELLAIPHPLDCPPSSSLFEESNKIPQDVVDTYRKKFAPILHIRRNKRKK